MEEVLDVLNQPRDEHAPVVALDERPVQLLGSLRPDTPMAPGQPARSDYEYAVRHCQCVLRGRAQGRSPSDPRHGKPYRGAICGSA